MPWGLVQVSVVAVSSGRRYRAVRRSLATRGDLSGVVQGGLPIAELAGSGMVVALLAVAFVLSDDVELP